MSLYCCKVCKFRYDEWLGDSKNGVPPGVSLKRLAGSVCTTCGMREEGRHERMAEAIYSGDEALYYDQFAGKTGIVFYRDLLLQEEQPPSVLELGVGTGRIAIELAQHGIEVCGVDWSAQMLELAEKKRRRMLKGKEHLLELIQQNVWELEVDRVFSHVLLPEGFFQQAMTRAEQQQLLQIVQRCLRDEGIIVLELILPPLRESWSYLQRKWVFPDRLVYQRVEGESSLLHQRMRYSITYETYLDQIEQQPRYRVEREMALILPGELSLLLELSGFSVLAACENHERFWEADAHDGYERDRWQFGGYPFAAPDNQTPRDASARFTVIAKKVSG